jgi:glycine cleavage system regulatory protein
MPEKPEHIDISMRIESDHNPTADAVSDAMDALADELGARILWNYVEPKGTTDAPVTLLVELEGKDANEILVHLDEIIDRIINGYETGAGWKYRDKRKGA